MTRLPLIAFIFVLAFAAKVFAAAGPTVETGEIAGAKFAIARPERWNGKVLLIAHGYRAENRPLVADLFPEHLAYRELLQEGWVVAKTSYRRNGLIVKDAIADIDALRAHIARGGALTRVLLEGDSMGGLIVTLIAERQKTSPVLYHGAVAIGAALTVREPGATYALTQRPQVPVLFLTNQSELEGPAGYVAEARKEKEPMAALFRVARDGHVNVNQRERLVALRALEAWLDRGVQTLPRPAAGADYFDATVAPQAQPSRVTMQADKQGFDVRTIEVSGVYGNVFIEAQPADFSAVGIGPGASFQLRVGERTFAVKYGSDFSSVPRGEWVVFPNADGFFWLARNFGDAAATADIKAGDRVTIRTVGK